MFEWKSQRLTIETFGTNDYLLQFRVTQETGFLNLFSWQEAVGTANRTHYGFGELRKARFLGTP